MVIHTIFASSASLLNMTRKVLNINFVFFAFFEFFIYPFFRNNIQNLSGIFLCPELVSIKLSEIFMSDRFRTFSVFIKVKIKMVDEFRTIETLKNSGQQFILSFSWT